MRCRRQAGDDDGGGAERGQLFIGGQLHTTLRGTYDELAEGFRKLVDDYVERKYPRK